MPHRGTGTPRTPRTPRTALNPLSPEHFPTASASVFGMDLICLRRYPLPCTTFESALTPRMPFRSTPTVIGAGAPS